MATPVFCCGAECGQLSTGAGVGEHWVSAAAAVSFSTTTVRSGARSLRLNPSAAASNVTVCALPSYARLVGRFYLQFASLPTADQVICGTQGTVATANVRFKQSDSKLYAGVGTTLGATGVSVTTGIWYRIDFDFNVTAGNDTSDVQVDGTACGQASATGSTGSTTTGPIFGNSIANTFDLFIDDVVLSQTAADYPLGAGHVDHFVPTADGTHNVAGTNDFERGGTGTDILNATTDAYLLIDDVPLDDTTPDTNDYINMIAPPNATDYVECVFGPAPGISTPTAGPRAVEVIAGIHQAGTGLGNMEIRLNDNGTTNAVYSATGVAGTTTIIYKRKHYATAPTGGAWTATSGAGNFNNLKMQFGSPAALDVNPDQFLDCIMIEAEFIDVPLTPRILFHGSNINQALHRGSFF